MLFEELGLRADLLRAVRERGYATTTPIQRKAIPLILEDRDALAGAQTGTGKTAALTLPLLQRRANSESAGRRPRGLILTPTRELAAQVGESVRTYGRHLPIRAIEIIGGVGMQSQVSKLRKRVDIIVATPGRLLDHVEQSTVDLSGIEVLVLDEADRILDMGFIRDVRRIIKALPQNRQTLLFSATFSKQIRQLAGNLLTAPVEVQVAQQSAAADKVRQLVHPVDRRRKRELLSRCIRSGNWQQVLVFTRTKYGANRLAEQLAGDGIKAAAIHGNKSQGARTRALGDFKSRAVRLLVATDIAARGLDINALPHVVNYELPNVAGDYVHRIGRTARAGRDGHAVSLVCVDERQLLDDIERLLRIEIEQAVVPGYEPDPRIRAEPIQNGRAQPSSGRGNGRTRHRHNASAFKNSGRSRNRRDFRQAIGS
jgi:ATP-dependent RNA helicase RhlE